MFENILRIAGHILPATDHNSRFIVAPVVLKTCHAARCRVHQFDTTSVSTHCVYVMLVRVCVSFSCFYNETHA